MTAQFSQAPEKLAFIHAFRYSVVDFGGVDWPPHENLRDITSSLRGGEKPSTPLLKRLTTPFGRVAAPLMMALAPAAYANDGASVHPASISSQQTVNPDYGTFGTFNVATVPKRVARRATARASNDRLAVVAYGIQPPDKHGNFEPMSFAFYSKVSDAIAEAQKDYSEVVLVIGTSDPAQFDVGEYRSMTNPMHVEVYENGDLVNGDGGHVLPYLETDEGLIENTGFAGDMEIVFSVAKPRLVDSLEIERKNREKQASLSGPVTGTFPN